MADNDAGTISVRVRANDDVTLPLKQIESSIIRFVGAVASAMAVFKNLSFEIRSAADLQKELLNIQKTTDFTSATIQKLSRDLLEMSKQVNVSAVDLAKIAAIGGQLGLGSQGAEALRQFTESAARMSSVLDVSVEEAGNGIAKISNIFNVGLRDAERIVSAFNELSNNSTASGRDLLDVVQRLGNAGGSLKLEESLALAATGRDLGLTLETIGTSFTKIFLDMQAKAADFASLMKVSTKDWAHVAATDGLGALKMYIAKLRELRADERARIAEQLTGGGRVFSLVNKLVQDSNNTLIGKNLGFASSGFTTGTSAIKEQKTVLQGFNAQVEILKNHFTALAIEAGEKALPAVTSIVIALQQWLNDPAVREGFINFSQSIGAFALAIADAVRWVASLNVNWGLLAKALGVFALGKIVSFFLTWATSIRAVRNGLEKLAGFQVLPRPGFEQVGPPRPTQTFGQQVASFFGVGARNANRQERKEAQKALTAANANFEIAEAKRVAAAEAELADRRAAVDKELTANHTLNARKRAAADKLAAKEAAAAAELAALAAQGADAATLAAREAKLNKGIAISRTLYARNIADAERAAEAEIAAIHAVSEQYAAALARRTAEAQAAAGAQVAANARVQAAAQSATLTTGAVISGVIANLGKLLGRLFSAGMWIALGAALLDMIGLLDPLTKGLHYVAEALHIVSKEQDAIDAAARRNLQNLKKYRDDLKATRDELVKQVATSVSDPETIQQNLKIADGDRNATLDESMKVVDSVIRSGRLVNVEQAYQGTAAPQALTDLGEELLRVSRLIKQFDDALAKSKRDRETYVQANQKTMLFGTAKGEEALASSQLDVLDRKIRQQEETLGDLQVQRARIDAALSNVHEKATAASKALVEDHVDKLQRLRPVLGELFNDVTVSAINTYVRPLAALKKQIAEAQKARDELQKTVTRFEGRQGDDHKLSTDDQKTLAAAQSQINVLDQSLIGYEKQIQQLGNAWEDAKIALGKDSGEVGLIERFLLGSRSPEELEQLITQIRTLKAEGGELKGTVIANLPPAKTPDGLTGLTRTEQRQIDVATERMRAEQSAIEAKRSAEREMQINEFLYEHGLRSLASYYSERLRLQKGALEKEHAALATRRNELDVTIEGARSDNKPLEVAKLGIDRDRLTREMAEKRREITNLPQELAREATKALEDLETAAIDREARLFDEFGLVAEAAARRIANDFKKPITAARTELAAAQAALKTALGKGDDTLVGIARRTLAVKQLQLDVLLKIQNLTTIRAELQQFTDNLKLKIDLGLVTPTGAVNAIRSKTPEVMDALQQEIVKVRQQLDTTGPGAERTILELQLEGLTLQAYAAEKSLKDLQQNALARFREDIDVRVRIGALSPFQGGEAVAQFQREQAKGLADEIDREIMKIADGTALSVDASKAKIEQLKAAYIDLRNTVSDLGHEINGGARNGLVAFFSDTMNGVKRMHDAFRDFRTTLKNLFVNALSQDAVDKWFKPLISGQGSFGDLISGMFGGKVFGKEGAAAKAAAKLRADGTATNPFYVRLLNNLTGGETPAADAVTGGEGEKAIQSDGTGLWDSVKAKASDTWDWVSEKATDTWDSIADTASQFWTSLKDVFSGIGDWFSSAGGEGGWGTAIASFFGFADGGFVAGPGSATSDSIPAYLSNGEFVVRAEQTRRWRPLLELINTGRISDLRSIPDGLHFAEGGFVGGAPAAARPGRSTPSELRVVLDESALGMTMDAWLNRQLATR